MCLSENVWAEEKVSLWQIGKHTRAIDHHMADLFVKSFLSQDYVLALSEIGRRQREARRWVWGRVAILARAEPLDRPVNWADPKSKLLIQHNNGILTPTKVVHGVGVGELEEVWFAYGRVFKIHGMHLSLLLSVVDILLPIFFLFRCLILWILWDVLIWLVKHIHSRNLRVPDKWGFARFSLGNSWRADRHCSCYGK